MKEARNSSKVDDVKDFRMKLKYDDILIFKLIGLWYMNVGYKISSF